MLKLEHSETILTQKTNESHDRQIELNDCKFFMLPTKKDVYSDDPRNDLKLMKNILDHDRMWEAELKKQQLPETLAAAEEWEELFREVDRNLETLQDGDGEPTECTKATSM